MWVRGTIARAAAAAGLAVLLGAGGARAAAAGFPRAGHPPSVASAAVISVSPTGTDSATCGASTSPCATINQAITNAPANGTVLVAPGIYKQQVVLTKPLTLTADNAVVDASGLSSGSGQTLDAAAILLTAAASGSTVEGFAVHGALGEGILVMGAQDVRIANNFVSGNDLGTPATTTYAECQAQGQVPGDCGEGIHLMSATNSTVTNNRVADNSGGILLTDELGPATRNRIIGNVVDGNLFDCGVTLASHSTTALTSSGARQPAKGGVFANLVQDNIVADNGTLGSGAGVLIAAAVAGGASYANVVSHNLIEGNGQAGITIHAHATPQDLSGNVLTDNLIGTNNLAGDPDAKVSATTGILVFSSGPAVSVTIRKNTIVGNSRPIAASSNVTITR